MVYPRVLMACFYLSQRLLSHCQNLFVSLTAVGQRKLWERAAILLGLNGAKWEI